MSGVAEASGAGAAQPSCTLSEPHRYEVRPLPGRITRWRLRRAGLRTHGEVRIPLDAPSVGVLLTPGPGEELALLEVRSNNTRGLWWQGADAVEAFEASSELRYEHTDVSAALGGCIEGRSSGTAGSRTHPMITGWLHRTQRAHLDLAASVWATELPTLEAYEELRRLPVGLASILVAQLEHHEAVALTPEDLERPGQMNASALDAQEAGSASQRHLQSVWRAVTLWEEVHPAVREIAVGLAGSWEADLTSLLQAAAGVVSE